jgi:N-acetylmuramoyl-L-alanine amidase
MSCSTFNGEHICRKVVLVVELSAYEGKTGVTRVRMIRYRAKFRLTKPAITAIFTVMLSLFMICRPAPLTLKTLAAPVPSTFEGFSATVVGDVCNLRSGPDTTYKSIGLVKMGTVVNVLSYENNWARVRHGNVTGFIAGWLIDIDLASKSISARITATDVNVREGPGTDYKVKSMTNRGMTYAALVKRGAWVKVMLTPGGESGWISEGLLALETQSAEAPSEPTVPAQPPVNTDLVVFPVRDSLTITQNAVSGSPAVARLSRGESAKVINAEGAFLMVETSSGLRGWIYGPDARIASVGDPALKFIVSESAWTIGKYPSSTVTATDVNFRSGPGTSYPVIGSLDKGDVLRVLEVQGDWMHAVSPKGITGWVAAWLTSGSTPSSSGEFTVSAKANGADRRLTVTGPFKNSVVVPSPDGGAVIVSTSDFFNTSVELPVYSYEFGRIKVAGSDVTVTFQGKANYSTVKTTPGSVELQFTPMVTSLAVRSAGNTDILTINTLGYAVADVKREGDVVSLFLPGAALDGVNVPSVRGQSVRGVTVSPRDGGVSVAVRTSGNPAYTIKRTTNTIEAVFGVSGLTGKKIIVDPGHEADDPGAIGPTGLAERNVNWEMAVRLVNLLNQAGASAQLTRQGLYATSEGPEGWVPVPGEYSHSLSERAAWSCDADLFISIHNNWNYDRSVAGTTLYVCDKNPNAAESRRFASMALSELTLALGTRDMGVRDSNFYVCREAQCPAVLAEVMFLSNPVEESYLRQAQTWDKAAQGLLKAVQRYFGQFVSTPGI